SLRVARSLRGIRGSHPVLIETVAHLSGSTVSEVGSESETTNAAQHMNVLKPRNVCAGYDSIAVVD
ncbi:hypothetical protein, partial [Ruegeria arenilitoris]|uniref:hypothetical protein n=1 Tax=Ruegeria arenilitoris TaxID=1173585 RepID=UPI001C2C9C7F